MKWSMRLARFNRVINVLAAGLLAACGGQMAADNPIRTELILTNTPIVLTPEVTETPAPEPTQTGPARLVIWWPEPIAPAEDSAATAIRSEQIGAFQATQDNLLVESRLKQEQDIGGIMDTLRTASAVAPGALPDLTLIRYEDLQVAAQAGLVQPLEGRVSSAILGNLYDSALQLGQVDGQLYGLPYMLEVNHVVYRPLAVEGDAWSFNSVLAEGAPFVFPANRINGVNDVFLVQYLAAGGTLSEDGTLDEDALRSTLEFYERAVAAGIVNSTVLDYSEPANYEADLAAGTIPFAVVTSTVYLEMIAAGEDLNVGLIPTSSGQPMTLLDGWMWVMTTSDVDRQTSAIAYLNWMLEADRQGEYSQSVHMYPSQRRAVRNWFTDDYAIFVSRLLDNATLPVPESQNGVAARAMQNAFTAVILGARTAEEATQDALDQLVG
jgi:ABC-type glycerol-3-phosphate transport system substrate-binding protein